MKKIIKILPVLLMIIIVASCFSNVFAVTNPKDLKGDENITTFDNLGKKIIGGVQAVGSIVSVLILVVLGIKYMIGSAEEKAEYKKTLMPYVIGAVLIFAASNIASFIYSFSNSINAAQ